MGSSRRIPIALLLVLGITALMSGNTHASCLDPLLPRLADLKQSLRAPLQEMTQELTRLVRVTDGAVQDTLPGSLLQELRSNNCAQIEWSYRHAYNELHPQAGEVAHPFSISGSGRRSLIAQLRYTEARKALCEANRHLARLNQQWSDLHPREVANHLRALQALTASIDALPANPAARASRERARSLIQTIPTLLVQLRERCPACFTASQPQVLSANQRANMRMITTAIDMDALSGEAAAETTRSLRRRSSQEDDPTLREEARRLLQAQRERNQALARERERRERELDQPAQLTPKPQLLRRTRDALAYSQAHGGAFPPGFDWAMTRLGLDAHDQRPRLTRRQLQDIQTRWQDSLARYREIANTESDPVRRVTRVANEIVREYLTNYKDTQDSITQAFLGQGSNCETRTNLLLAAMNQIPGLIPTGYTLGVQHFPASNGLVGHVQAVLIPNDPNNHQVWDLMTNTSTERRAAPIYAPGLALRGTLSSSRVSDAALLLRGEDPDAVLTADNLTPEQRTALNADAARSAGRQSRQRWSTSSSSRALYSASSNPAEAQSAPPSVGAPTRVNSPRTIAQSVRVSDTRRAPERTESDDSGTPDISHPVVRLAYDRLGTDNLFNGTVRRLPNASPEEILEEMQAATWWSHTPTGRSLSICNVAIMMNLNCLDIPQVRGAVAQARRRVDEARANPERLLQGRRFQDQPFQLLTDIAQDADLLLRAGGRGPWTRSFRSPIDDTNPAASIYDWMSNLDNLAPELSEAEAQRLLAEQRSSTSNIPSRRNTPTAGTVSTSSPRRAPETSPLNARYTIPLEQYRRVLGEIIRTRVAPESQRMELLARFIRFTPDLNLVAPDLYNLCGNKTIHRARLMQISNLAENINPSQPRIPCPPGSTSNRTPEEEYRAAFSWATEQTQGADNRP